MSSCVICTAALRDAPVVASHARFERESRRVACVVCGMIQADPLPHRAELDVYYRSHEYRRDHGEVAIHWPPVGVVRPSSPQYAEAYAAMGRSRYVHALAITGKPEPGVVLDIGCASGHVLDVYAEEGWLCYGIEPDEEEAAKALAGGHAVKTTTFDRYEPPDLFDLIVAHHVLEHLHDPIGELRRMRGMLAEGGSVVIEVPNIEHPTGALSQNYFQWVHLWDFSRWTLASAMLRAGLTGDIRDASSALWAVGKPCEPQIGEMGRGGAWWAGYLDGYRCFGGGD